MTKTLEVRMCAKDCVPTSFISGIVSCKESTPINYNQLFYNNIIQTSKINILLGYYLKNYLRKSIRCMQLRLML